MRPAGAFVASVLAALRDATAVGVNLLALDALADPMIAERGATYCSAAYGPSVGAMPLGEVLSSNLQCGGHGVGRTMHGDPHVPNDGRPGRGLPLRAGLVIAIEPWFMHGTDQIFTDPDGWTLRSADGSRGAHSEHTIAITED